AGHLRIADLKSLCLVNKRISNLCRDPKFWQFKILIDYGQCANSKPDHLTFRQFYFRLRGSGNLLSLSSCDEIESIHQQVSICVDSVTHMIYIDIFDNLYLLASSEDKMDDYIGHGIFNRFIAEISTKPVFSTSYESVYLLEQKVIAICE